MPVFVVFVGGWKRGAVSGGSSGLSAGSGGFRFVGFRV